MDVPASRSSDIGALPFSMGQVRPGLRLTGAVCLATALRWRLHPTYQSTRMTPPESPASGVGYDITTGSKSLYATWQWPNDSGSGHKSREREEYVERVTVCRTVRRLLEGNVLV